MRYADLIPVSRGTMILKRLRSKVRSIPADEKESGLRLSVLFARS
jgi:hypothetical protein